MAFEALLNKPMTEPQLLDLLIAETQKNYRLHQNTYYFFKLKYSGNKTSEIIWMKSFSSNKDFADFFYDAKFFRAAIMLKFIKKGCYVVMCQSFCYADIFEIWPDKILNSEPIFRHSEDYEKTPTLPREVIELGFGEITQAVASSKSKIPV